MPAKKIINLLPDKDNQNSFSAKALAWLTTAGRGVIITTELVVVAAFLSRFYLDRKNADLSEILRQQKAVLESTKEFEKDFLQTQSNLKTIKDLKSEPINYSQYLDVLKNSLFPEIIINQINIKVDQMPVSLSLVASSISENSLVNFISTLSENPLVETVTVQGISKKTKTVTYEVSLVILFKAKTENKL